MGCKRAFEVYPSSAEQLYHSRACYRAAMAVKFEADKRRCEVCDKKRPSGRERWCSVACREAARIANAKEHVGKIKKTCEHCGITFYVQPSWGKRRFHSLACRRAAEAAEKASRSCEVCGKPRESWSTRFCSWDCYKVANNKSLVDPTPFERDGIMVKWCVTCEDHHPVTEFYARENGQYRNDCKAHRKEYSRLESTRNNRRRSDLKHRFRVANEKAKAKGRSLDIDEVTWSNLVDAGCFYCRRPIESTGVGLDRIDNDFGYFIWNVVPCCGRCNQARFNNFTQEEFCELSPIIRKIDAMRERARKDGVSTPMAI